jgi:hypothetical protein
VLPRQVHPQVRKQGHCRQGILRGRVQKRFKTRFALPLRIQSANNISHNAVQQPEEDCVWPGALRPKKQRDSGADEKRTNGGSYTPPKRQREKSCEAVFLDDRPQQRWRFVETGAPGNTPLFSGHKVVCTVS